MNLKKDNKRLVTELAAAASSAQAGQLERDDLQAKHTVSCSGMVLLGRSTWEGLQGGWCAGRLRRLRLSWRRGAGGVAACASVGS